MIVETRTLYIDSFVGFVGLLFHSHARNNLILVCDLGFLSNDKLERSPGKTKTERQMTRKERLRKK